MCARAASPGGHNYDRENIPAILFVCTANQVRSPIAAAIFNQIQPVRFKAESAGTWTKSGLELAPFALRAAACVAASVALMGVVAALTVRSSHEHLNHPPP